LERRLILLERQQLRTIVFVVVLFFLVVGFSSIFWPAALTLGIISGSALRSSASPAEPCRFFAARS
jgi:hypothetical protein